MQAYLDKVSDPNIEQNKDTSLKTNKIEEEGVDKHLEHSPRKGESSQRIPRETWKYPTSHVPKIEDALVDGLWEELKQRKPKAQ